MDHLPPQVWFVDFEFSGTSEGNRPAPICCVARELRGGRTIRLWEDELITTCPYDTGKDALFVAYAAAAEMGCHLALGWPLPANILDLYAEFRNFTNISHVKGVAPAPAGMLDALEYFNLPPAIDKITKQRLQNRCARGGPWEPGDREEILAYCETDVTPLPALLEKLLPKINFEQALERGRFAKSIAHMEGTGLPIDVPKYNEVIRKRKLIIAKLITTGDKACKVYSGTTFKQDRFAAYLEREGITDWPVTAKSGRQATGMKTLGKTLAQHPQVRPFFDLKGLIDKLRKCELRIGKDGFARASLLPFVAITGRTQPPAKEFIFLQPAWMRFLIVAPPGFAVASLDWSGQEIAIAAALSGDKNLLAAYATGDAHLAAGKLFGIVPEDGTAETHATERGTVKPVMFGTNYGAGVPTLARTAGISEEEARKLKILHRRTFPTFWKWIEEVQIAAYRKGEIKTASGWTMRVPGETRSTTLMDWPMQATGGDMMRLAACMATEAGINLCCTVHDAFVLMAPIAEIRTEVAVMREIMNAASIKTIGFACDVHSDFFEHPKRFFDKKGAKMQAIVEEHLAELEGIEPPPPPTGNMWPARGVDRKLPPIEQKGEKKPIPASLWLDRHNYVTQIAWVPGEPQFMENSVILDGGLTDCKGHAIYNSYRPPTITPGDKKKATPWLNHVALCFSEPDAFHILGFLAHAVQRPFEKVNHALMLLSREHGIGKDTLLAPVRQAVGASNCAEASPEQFMGRFNGFAKSVLLRINEAKDLGGTDNKSRFAFYDRMKLYAASPPVVIRCDEKHKPEQHVLNRCHIVVTSNYIAGGLYLPKEDRRHYVAESPRKQSDFPAGYFKELWKWFREADGYEHVTAYLRAFDLRTFGCVNEPPPKTAAFWALVGSNSSPETASVENVLDDLGRPDAVTAVLRNLVIRISGWPLILLGLQGY